MTWRVYIEDQPWRMACRVHMARVHNDGKMDIVQPLVLESVEQNSVSPETVGVLNDVTREEATEFLRSIMDAAWELGIRPTNFTDHTNELTAVRYHLEDMRMLAKVKP